jgi:hypothetical protein
MALDERDLETVADSVAWAVGRLIAMEPGAPDSPAVDR